MRPETDIASEEYEDLLTRVESVEKITSGMNIGGSVDLGNVFARGLITGIFRSGDGIKDVDLTGFQMDGEELVGQVSGVDQVVLDADTGLLTAGAGDVTLDANGITIIGGTYARNKLIWEDADESLLTEIYPATNATNTLNIVGYGVDAECPTGRIILTAFDYESNNYARLTLYASDDGTTYMRIYDPLQFNDANTLIEEDGSSNLSFKDANAGTLTLKQLYGQKIVMGAPTELTISSGAITATQSNHYVDTESDDASDDLDTINGGVDGMILTLSTVVTTRDVVVKNNTGNIRCGADFTLGTLADSITFKYDATSSKWRCMGKENN